LGAAVFAAGLGAAAGFLAAGLASFLMWWLILEILRGPRGRGV